MVWDNIIYHFCGCGFLIYSEVNVLASALGGIINITYTIFQRKQKKERESERDENQIERAPAKYSS